MSKKNLTNGAHGAAFFTSPDGKAIVLDGYFFADEGGILMSPDGKTFYELLVTDKGRGSTYGKQFSFYDPHQGVSGMLHKSGDGKDCKLTVDATEYTRAIVPGSIEVVRLPDELTLPLSTDQEAELFKAGNGEQILFPQPWRGHFLWSADGTKFIQNESGHFGGSASEHHQMWTDPVRNVRGHLSKLGDTLVFGGEQIARKRYTYTGAEDLRKPFITVEGKEFVVLDEVAKKHNLSAEQIVDNAAGNIHIGHECLMIGATVFEKDTCPTEVTVVRLPTVREAFHLLKATDGRYFYISQDKYRLSYQTFRLFIGSLDAMIESPVRDVSRYRDGGTTNITSEAGFLHVPAPQKNEPSAFTDADLLKVFEDEFKALDDASKNWLERWKELRASQEQRQLKLEVVDTNGFDIVETDDGVTIKAKG